MKILWLAAVVFCSTAGARAANLSYTPPAVPDQMDPDTFFKWEQPTLLQTTLHTTAMLAVWVDVLQSRNCPKGQYCWEKGPIMVPLVGTNPSKGQFFWVGGVATTAALTCLWYISPPKIRYLLDAGIMGVEIYTIADNSKHVGFNLRF